MAAITGTVAHVGLIPVTSVQGTNPDGFVTLSVIARDIMFAQNTDNGLLVLLTMTHPSLPTDIRAVNNKEDVVSRGDLFIGFAFNLTLPADTPNVPPRAQLTIDNVSAEIGESIRLVSGDIFVLIEIVRLKTPDAVEIVYPLLKMRNVRWNEARVSAELRTEDLKTESYPGDSFTPGFFPGLF